MIPGVLKYLSLVFPEAPIVYLAKGSNGVVVKKTSGEELAKFTVEKV